MLMHVLTNTPKWVFILFVALLWLGVRQMLPRSVSIKRATFLSLAMTGLSLYGVVSAFGESPQALLAWLGAAVVALLASLQIPTSGTTRYDATNQKFHLPGSSVPLALFMAIFFTKYAVGASIGMEPSLAHDRSFALIISALYGSFSGIFLARATGLWRLAMNQTPSPRSGLASKAHL